MFICVDIIQLGGENVRKYKGNPDQIFIGITFITALIFSVVFTAHLTYYTVVAGLTPLQLVLIGTALEATVFIFEIPTGIVADMKSRKLSVIIGFLLIGIGFIIESYSPRFLNIIIAQFVWGIGHTFISGALQAWISDEVGENKSSKLFIKGNKYEKIGELIGIPISIAVSYVSISLTIGLSGICFLLLSLYLIFYMEERGFKPAIVEKGDYRFRNMFLTVIRSKDLITKDKLAYLLIVGALFLGLYSEGLDRLWNPYLINEFNLPNIISVTMFFGVLRLLFIIINIVTINIFEYKKIHENKVQILHFLCVAIIFIAIGLIGLSRVDNLYLAIAILCLINASRNIIYPLYDIMLNSCIKDSSIRATMFSIRGQVDSIGQTATGPIIGLIGSRFSIRIAFIACSMLLLPAVYIFKLIKDKLKNS